MKISSLISLLQAIESEHGNLDVTVEWEGQTFLLEDARQVDVWSKDYPLVEWVDPVKYPKGIEANGTPENDVAGIFVAKETPGWFPKRVLIDADHGYSWHRNIDLAGPLNWLGQKLKGP